MKLSSIMTGGIETIPPQATLAEAAKKMASQDIGSLPVCAERQRVVGIITDRDITVRAVAEGRNPSEVQLGDICTPDPTTVSPSEPVKEALERMRQQAIRRLIVADAGKPLGIVSLGDLSDHGEADDTLRDISEAPANS